MLFAHAGKMTHYTTWFIDVSRFDTETMTHQYFQMATLQTMKLKEIKDSWNDNAIDLTEVDYLLITWKNDPFKGRGKVPFLSKVETIDLDDLECDNVNSLEETTVTLDRCIQMFSESEILEKSEYWYCSTCKVCIWGVPLELTRV